MSAHKRRFTPEQLSAAANDEPLPATPLFAANDFRAVRYLHAEPPPRRWLMQDVIPAGIVFQMIAPGGTGKTMASLQLGVACATGVPFAGIWETGEAGAVLMLLGEDDDEELHRRVFNIAKHVAVTEEARGKLAENLYIKSVIGTDTLLTTTDPHTKEVVHTGLVERVILTAKQIPNLKLIVIDPASRFRGGDENSSADATRFVQALERVTQATGAALLLIHHANKNSMNSATASQGAARGSSALTDAVRLQINLSPITKENNKLHKIPEDEMRQHLILSITKTNYSAPQNDILLKRGEGGYLSHVVETPRRKESGRINAEIIKTVQSEITEGRRHSRTGFVKVFGSTIGIFKLSRRALQIAVDDLIEDGSLRVMAGTLQ